MGSKKSKLATWTNLSFLLSLFTIIFLSGVNAFSSGVESDLKETRAALIKQRSDLEGLIDRKSGQISSLQADVDRLRAYLKDTDHALSSVDAALRGH